MSRFIQEVEDGKPQTIIASMQQCRYLVNNFCCNKDHRKMIGKSPNADYCRRCEYFTKEDGKL